MVALNDFTLSFTSVARHEELNCTLARVVGDIPNIQVILNGANPDEYLSVRRKHEGRVKFIENQENLGIAAAWNQGIVSSSTRYVILSGDDLEYTPNWYNPLLNILNTVSEDILQVSLCSMSFSSFCIDKKLIAKQGWFDHNFTMVYYEDEDWYLRFRERLGLYNNPIPYEDIIPNLRTVIRNPHKRTPWNPLPNITYFNWKWKQVKQAEEKTLHSRQMRLYKRRLPEPQWPLMEKARVAYAQEDYQEQEWRYSIPKWELRLLTRLTTNPLFIRVRRSLSNIKNSRMR